VRSPLSCDKISFAHGDVKSLSGLFSAAKIPAGKRSLIPVIEVVKDGAPFVAAVMGSALGYRDWISGYAEHCKNTDGAYIHIEGMSDGTK
jgi:hypothetical protein